MLQKINKWKVLLQLIPTVVCIVCVLTVTLGQTQTNVIQLGEIQEEQTSNVVYKLTSNDALNIANKVKESMTSDLVYQANSIEDSRQDIIDTISAQIQSDILGVSVSSTTAEVDVNALTTNILNEISKTYSTTEEVNNQITNTVTEVVTASLTDISARIDNVETLLASTITDVKDNTDSLTALENSFQKLSTSTYKNTKDIDTLSTELTSFKSETVNALVNLQSQLDALNNLSLGSSVSINNLRNYVSALQTTLVENDMYISQTTSVSIKEICDAILNNTASLTTDITSVNNDLYSKYLLLTESINTLGLSTDASLSILTTDLNTKITNLDVEQKDSATILSDSIAALSNEITSTVDDNKTDIESQLNLTLVELLSILNNLQESTSASDAELLQRIQNLKSSLETLDNREVDSLIAVLALITNLQETDVNLNTKLEQQKSELETSISQLRLYSESNVDLLNIRITDLTTYTDSKVVELVGTISTVKTDLEKADSLLKAELETNVSDLTVMINKVSTDLSALDAKVTTNLLEKVYPIGAIYISTSSTNPGTIFGGTWESWGTGQVPVGVDTSNSLFNTVSKTGGSLTNTLAIANLPAHSFTYSSTLVPTGTVSSTTTVASAGAHAHTFSWSGAPTAYASTSVSIGTTSLKGQFGNAALEPHSSSGASSSDYMNASGVFSKAPSTDKAFIVSMSSGTQYTKAADLAKYTDQVVMDASHSHTASASTSVGINAFTVSGTTSSSGAHTHPATTSSTFTGNTATVSGATNTVGSGAALNNVQPYITCYMWKRIS